MKKIKCARCEYAQPDKSASTRTWTAVCCRNSDSEFCGAVLNVTAGGTKQNSVSWSGCTEESVRS